MDVVLMLIGVAMLLVLMAISTVRLLANKRDLKEADARAWSGAAQKQHEESLARRAAVRARHAEKMEAG